MVFSIPQRLRALTQVLVRLSLDDKFRQRGLLLLSKICRSRGIIPASYVLRREHIRVGEVCYHGGFADVSDGEYSGTFVAIKCLKMNEGDPERAFKVPSIHPTHCHRSTFTQGFCREIIGWKHLSHPNILPLLGVSVSVDPRCFRILTEWMPNGNVIQYTISNPEANRLQLVSPLAVSPHFFPLFTDGP